MPEGSPGTGFDIRRLFSPGTQAREGREDPRTEPHVPAHAAPENPTPITLEDMSNPEGVGSASKAEATLTHPSARDRSSRAAGKTHTGQAFLACGLPCFWNFVVVRRVCFFGVRVENENDGLGRQNLI